MEIKARAQYNDYIGTAAADGHDWTSLKDYLANKLLSDPTFGHLLTIVAGRWNLSL